MGVIAQSPGPPPNDTAAGRRILKAIAEKMAAEGITYEDVGRLSRLSSWQQAAKLKRTDGTDEIVVTDLHGFQLSPAWDQDPLWPVVAPPPAVKISAAGRPKPISRDHQVVVCLPDPQIGYWLVDDGTLIEMHDEAAMDVAVQLIRHVAADKVINLGDTLDMSEWSSKFVVHPEFVATTQAALDRTQTFLADQRANMPADLADPKPVKKLIGNHDDRLALAIARNAKAALRLRKANTPESWPVLSLENLLDVDAIGVEVSAGYPAGRFKIADGYGTRTPLFARHGTETSDMKRVADRSRQSWIEGHSHHIQEHHATFELDGEPCHVVAVKLGCLARTDGAVPSFYGGLTARGRPAPTVENWQQAVGVVRVWPDGDWRHDIVEIDRGRAFYDGVWFEASRCSTPLVAA